MSRDRSERRARISLRTRLSLVALAVSAVAVALLGAVVLTALHRNLVASSKEVLREQTAAVLATVDVDAAGRLSVAEPGDRSTLDAATWVFDGSQVLERANAREDVQRRVRELVGRGDGFARGPDDLLLHAQAVRLADRQVGTIVAARSPAADDRSEHLVQLTVLGLGALVLLGAFFATRVTVGRALRPVSELTTQAAEWSALDVTRRFGTGARPVELAELAATLDGVLDRLSAVLRREQQLTAELSHELRTPLARVVGEMELAQSRERTPEELGAAHAAVLRAAHRMTDILATLLAGAQTGPTPGRCDVVLVLTELAAQHPQGAVVVDPGPSPTAGVEQRVLARVVSPLVDNALRYARTPVRLSVTAGPTVLVTDDGPGVPADLVETVFEPGFRGDRSDGHPGGGLGLPLARRLAREAGGDVILRSGSPSGAVAVVTLPSG